MNSLFILAGERSGDRHGAGLMEELRQFSPGLEIHGLGGGEMHALCPAVTDWVDEAGVVGIVEVLKKYGWFKKKFDETLAAIRRLKPDAVVFIDYPGFNLRMAKALRDGGFSGRLVYYISPQVWAWHRGRIPKMAAMLDLMICIFPFEKALYEGHGLPTIFGGHPLVEYHRKNFPEPAVREPGLIGLFPGSRRREITKLFPILIETARRMRAADPSLKFAASAASEKLAVMMRALLEAAPLEGLTIETGTMHTLMRRVECGAVASGTATLEAAIHGLPHCLIYRVALGTYLFAKAVIKVEHLGMVNLLAGREIVRELLQSDCTPAKISEELLRLHRSPEAREALAGDMKTIVDGLAGDGAYRRAAQAILEAARK
ncbi:MAG: lipid-A-disaccharide synthase [Verrucomicrobiota bacterium]